MWVSTKRVFRYGTIGFFRNGFISLSAILILTITLFVVHALIVSGAALTSTLEQLKDKVDINIYFRVSATEDQILVLKKQIDVLPEVKETTYTSREEALANFRERHKNDQLTIQALDELEDNPLGATLSIRAKETSQYESIAKFLDGTQGVGDGQSSIIEKINFFQNKAAIDKLSNIIETSRRLGFAVALFLGLASILIAFNTIRLAIYTSRDEINVMRLVGASSWYVRGPFLVSGVLYGLTSAVLVLLVSYPLAGWLAAPSEAFFGSFNTLTYLTENITQTILTIVLTGVCLGVISSFLAVRRYLNV